MKGRTIQPGAVLITGCSSGIGYATAKALQVLGWDVVASARSSKDVDRLREEGLKCVRIDNLDSQTIADGFREAVRLSNTGRVWGVFCNAGYGQAGAIEDVSVEGMREQLLTNVVGTHAMAIEACRHMRQHGGGRILINSSVLGLVGMPMRGVYVASKFALEGWSDVMRLEVADANIGVVLLEPGPVLTRFRQNSLAALRRHVRVEGSPHAERYERLARRLATEGAVVPFTVSAATCAKVAVRALTCRRPKARYRVTVQTKVFAALKRIMPTRMLDWVSAKG